MPGNVSSIQFLRFVAATLVVFVHATEATNVYWSRSTPEMFSNFAVFGAVGVHIFFVISGFIMFYTTQNRFGRTSNAKSFLIRRLIRIYPIFWIYTVLYLVVRGVFMHPYDLSISQIFASTLLVPGFAPSVIGPGWTLPFEMFFYLCFSVVMLLSFRAGIAILTTVFVVLVGIGSFLENDNPILKLVTNSLLLEFLFGVWVGIFVTYGPPVHRRIANVFLVLAFLGFSVGFFVGFFRYPSVIMWGIPSALLIAGVVLQERNGAAPKFVTKFAFFGDSSYSLYLLHVIVIDVFILIFVSLFKDFDIDPIVVTIALAFFAFWIGMLGYYLVEQKLLRVMKALI